MEETKIDSNINSNIELMNDILDNLGSNTSKPSYTEEDYKKLESNYHELEEKYNSKVSEYKDLYDKYKERFTDAVRSSKREETLIEEPKEVSYIDVHSIF